MLANIVAPLHEHADEQEYTDDYLAEIFERARNEVVPMTSNPRFAVEVIGAVISALWIGISLRLGKTIGYATRDYKPVASRRDHPWAFWLTLAMMGAVLTVSLWKIAAGLIWT